MMVGMMVQMVMMGANEAHMILAYFVNADFIADRVLGVNGRMAVVVEWSWRDSFPNLRLPSRNINAANAHAIGQIRSE